MNLVVARGADAGREIPLRRGVVTLGQGADNDIDLHEPQASQRHLELRRFGEQWNLVDMGSANGTFLDGARLQVGRPYAVTPGAGVVIGATQFSLREDALRSAPPAPARPAPARPAPGPTSAARRVALWGGRLLVAAGCGVVAAGAQSSWLRLQVQLPIVGNVADVRFSGLQSGNGGVLLGAALLALLLLGLEVMAARWGTAAGLGEALLGLVAAVSLAFSLYLFYRAGTQQVFGISVQSLLSQVAPDAVRITIQPGLILVATGLPALLVGGILRVLAARDEPVT